jgi:peptidoglycan/LPS O-acetylase OafA/YrhL
MNAAVVELDSGNARNTARRKFGRIPELDGLRGFAILLVLLLHSFYVPRVPASKLYAKFQYLFSLGWTGVDLFFVLSGFLIGSILLEARGSKSYFRTFYVRRFFRIIPIYYLWISAYVVTVGLGGNVLRAHLNSGVVTPLGFPVYEHYLFVQNIWLPEYTTIFLAWMGLTWSLAVEEQFYVVAPFLVRYLRTPKLAAVLALLVLAAPFLRSYFYFHEFPIAFYSYRATPCRADALALGMLVAILWREEKFRYWASAQRSKLYFALGVLAGGMAALWYWFANPFHWVTLTIGYSWIGFFFALLLVVLLAHPGGPIARGARAKWLAELGSVSYCVYLIHIGVAYICFGLVTRSIPHITDLKSIGLTLVCIAVTLILAKMSARFIEAPLIRKGHEFSYGEATNN